MIPSVRFIDSEGLHQSPTRPQIRVSWSLGINFRWASDWGIASTYGGRLQYLMS